MCRTILIIPAIVFLLALPASAVTFVERYVTTSAGSGGDGTSGNPWTLTEAATSAVAGDRVNIKAGTYTLTASFSPANAGTQASPIEWRGYTTTIGDATVPVVTLDANGGFFSIVSCTQPNHRFRFLTVTGHTLPFASGFVVSGAGCILERCRATVTGRGFTLSGAGILALGCEADSFLGVVGFELSGDSTVALGCYAHDGAGDGFQFASFTGGSVLYSIADTCAGSGFRSTVTGDGALKTVAHCVAYNNAADGVRSDEPNFAAPMVLINTILASNGSYGISGESYTPAITLAGVAFHNNASGEVGSGVNIFELYPRVTLPGDPFVDAANGDFRLKPGATALLGSGRPAAYLSGGQLTSWTSSPDIGAAQQPVRPVFNPWLGGF